MLRLWDRSKGATVLDIDPGMQPANALSADGRVLVYSAEQGVFASANWTAAAPSLSRVDAAASGQPADRWADDDADAVALSGDGRVAVIGTPASNLVAGDSNGVADIFAKELWTAPAQLFNDTFTAADGTAWKSAWTTGQSNGSLTVKSGAGRMAVNNASGAYARAQLTGPPLSPPATC